MSFYLSNSRETLQEYIETMSELALVDIEIIDFEYRRIFATGILKKSIGKIVKDYKGLCETQFLKPGTKENTVKIVSPVEHEGKLIGYIGLISFTEEMQNFLFSNKDYYLKFIEQIKQFIGFNMYIYEERKVLTEKIDVIKDMLNNLKQNIIVFDDNLKVTMVNKISMESLNISSIDEISDIVFTRIDEKFMGKSIYQLTIGEDQYEAYGKLFDLDSLYKDYQKILILEEIKELDGFHKDHANQPTVDKLICNSQVMKDLKETLIKIAPNDSTVLINGESGTGKEFIAKIIHNLSQKKSGPFISINCSAIPDTLMESELFGYVAGAFEGANANGKKGKLELAHGGTIFLDKVGRMPIHMQVKLLTFLEDRKITPLGSNTSKELDIRIIAATNLDLKKQIDSGEFSPELYYRLNVIPIEVPPLRERKEDFTGFINRLINKYNLILEKNISGIDEESLNILSNYSWPGNIRELKNTIEYMMNISEPSGLLSKDLLPQGLLQSYGIVSNKENEIKSLEEIELEHIHRALEICGDNTEGKKKAADKLGIGVATLYRKLQK